MTYKSPYIVKEKKATKLGMYCNSCKHPIDIGSLCYAVKKSDGFIIKNVGFSCINCINDFK